MAAPYGVRKHGTLTIAKQSECHIELKNGDAYI